MVGLHLNCNREGCRTITRMKIWLSLLVFFVGFMAPAWAQGAFLDGEELSYVVKWTGVPAGEIDMKTHRLGDEKWQFELVAKTNSFWSMIHKVRDVVTADVSEKPFRSLVFKKDAAQGRRHILETIQMDYANSLVHRTKQNISAGEQPSTSEIKIEPSIESIQDPLSIIYLLRTFEFKHRQELDKKFHVFASKGIYELNFILKEELIFESSIFGPRRVWHIEPSAEYEGSLVSSGKLELWVDCDTGIPLRLVFNIPVGWATLELKSTNNPTLESTSFRQRRRR
jgi:hypothetical protein